MQRLVVRHDDQRKESEVSANYSKLALAVEPNVANDRLNTFFKDLKALREKHGIPDVHCIVQQNVLNEAGESPGLASIHLGDQRNALVMTSYAMGHAQGESQKFILSARSQGMKHGAEVALKEAKKYHDGLFGDEE